MKVVLASTSVPGVRGGAYFIVAWLEEMLRRAGHDVECYVFPFTTHWFEIPQQTAALRLVDLSRSGDRLIAVRTPSYVLRHPAKNVWFIHHFREAYDLWGTPYGAIPDTPLGRSVREAIHHADDVALGEARTIYTNSNVVTRRLREYNGIDAPPLYPPLFEPERFRCDDADGYIAYVSRVTSHKRQLLAIEAMAHVTTPVRLKVAGAPEDPAYVQAMRDAIRRLDLGARVELIDRYISEEEKIALLARCTAAAYLAYDEDSYGYASLEAAAARKPVIAVTDGGGTRELVVDGACGWMCEATPESVARAFDEAYADERRSKAFGEALGDRVRELGVDWDTTIERILA